MLSSLDIVLSSLGMIIMLSSQTDPVDCVMLSITYHHWEWYVIITRHCVIITGNDNYVIITDRSCWLCHVIDHLSSLGMICYHHRSCSSLAGWSSLTYPSPTLNPHLSLTQPSLSHTQPWLSLTQSSPIPHPTLNPHPTLTYPSHIPHPTVTYPSRSVDCVIITRLPIYYHGRGRRNLCTFGAPRPAGPF